MDVSCISGPWLFNTETGKLHLKKYVLKVDQNRLMDPRALEWILPLEKIDPLKNDLKQLNKPIAVDS